MFNAVPAILNASLYWNGARTNTIFTVKTQFLPYAKKYASHPGISDV